MADQKEDKSLETQVQEGSLLDQILSETKLDKKDETYAIAKRGVEAFITEMLAPGKTGQRVDKAAVDAMIAEIDQRISAQVNAILHAPAVQQLESTWRELKLLIDRVDFRENLKVEIANIPKDDAFRCIRHMRNLESLELAYDSLTDEEILIISNLRLNSLVFTGNYPTDETVSDLLVFSKIRFLYVPSGNLSDDSIEHLRLGLPSVKIETR